MKPTVGRIVHFHPRTGVTHAAIITFVHSETCVNLAVFDSSGGSDGKTSVQLVAPGQPKPEFGFFCEWMPYQVEKADGFVQAEACMTIPFSKATADAMERIIQKIDEKILAEG
jgi:hypothetical protein